MAFDVKGVLINMVLPILLGQAAEALGTWLDGFQEKSPEWHETVIIASYRLLSVHGAELAASTTNPYDDKAIDAAVTAIKANADKYGIAV